jgi:hypothetical protein
MTNYQTISWIFMATAMASEKSPANINSISMVADGINHAVPTHIELQTSFTWLISFGLITKQGKKYALTTKGINEYLNASETTSILSQIWNNLEDRIQNYA